jgi:Fur family ferric uptake transcriptional regulator
MAHAPEREEDRVLAAYLAQHGLKRSEQREVILDTFLRAARHLSVEDLLRIVQRRRPDIGRTTIYRTLKLLKEAGLASELTFGGQSRFEPHYNRDHHDHFICRSCGTIIEFVSPEIERIQEEIGAGLGFTIETHRHHIIGICRSCAARRAKKGTDAPAKARYVPAGGRRRLSRIASTAPTR